MSDFLTTAKDAVAYHWLTVVYFLLFSINSLALAIVASLMNAEWSELSHSSKFLVVVVIIGNWTNTMLSFINKTLHRAEQGKPLIETGDTTTITKT